MAVFAEGPSPAGKSGCPIGIAVSGALVLFGFVLGLGGCHDKPSGSTTPSDAGSATISSLTPEQAARVLAKVGDRAITLGEFASAIEHMDQFHRLRYQSVERRKELLEEMINVELLAAEARAKGYDKDPLTEQEIRAILREGMLAEVRKNAPNPNEIPDQEVKAYFDSHSGDFRDPVRRRLSLIVLRDEAAAKEALEAAKKVASDAQWGELVRQKSADPQARAGNVPVDLIGDYGFVSPPSDARGDNTRVPDAVRKAAFQVAKPKEVFPEVVEADGKYYVVRVAGETAARNRTYAEAERTIRVKLAQEKLRAKEDAFLDALRAKYPVKIDDAALARVKVELEDAGVDASKSR
jgi:peptidyl-prolyl cis-trans isomerase C